MTEPEVGRRGSGEEGTGGKEEMRKQKAEMGSQERGRVMGEELLAKERSREVEDMGRKYFHFLCNGRRFFR